eukprot:695097-Amphidinium_carterae.1
MAAASATWANLAELITEVGIVGSPDDQNSDAYAVCQLLGANAAQHWRPLAYLPDAYIGSVLENWTSADGSIPPPMLRGQVLAMISMAKDAVMALKRPAAPAVTAADLAKERTVKLNTVISQTTDEQVELVADDLVAAAYKRYKTVFGMFPEDNVDITVEQLTGVHQLLTTSQSPAKVDFALFVPYAARNAKKLKMTAMHFMQ